MKKLIHFPLILGILLIAGQAFGATYYASPTGSGTTCSEAAPCLLSYTLATKAASGDTVYIQAGNHGPFDQITVNNKNLTIIGVSDPQISFNANQHGFYFAGTSAVICSGFTVTTGGAASKRGIYFNSNGTSTLTNVNINGWQGEPVYATGGPTITWNLSTFKNINSAINTTSLQLAASTVTFNYCKFYSNGNATAENNNGVILVAGSTAIINNSVIADCESNNASVSTISASSGSLVINNSLIFANNLVGVTRYVIRQSGTGAITLNNTILQGALRRPGLITLGTVTINNAPTRFYPGLAENGKKLGFVSFIAVDSNHSLPDTGPGGTGTSLDHYRTTFNTLGAKLTYLPDDTDQYTSEQKTQLQNLVIDGHELGMEQKDSSDLTISVPFTVAYSGAGANPRVVITYTADNNATLALVTDSGTDLTINIGKGQTYEHIGSVVTQANSVVKAIHDHADWAATPYDGTSFDDTYSFCLEAGTHTVSGATDISLNREKWHTEHIINAKAEIEAAVLENAAITSYSARSFYSFPYKYSADAKPYIKTAGFDLAITGNTSYVDLSSISDTYQINNAQVEWAYWNAGETEATIKRNAQTLAKGVIFDGAWVSIVLPGSAGATAAHLTYFISELQAMGVPILTLSEVYDYLVANHTAVDDGFTKTLTNNYDFRLASNSPAIDAGVAVTGLHTSGSSVITGGDAAGTTKLYGAGIDIGAYERKKFLIDDLFDEMTPKYYTVPAE